MSRPSPCLSCPFRHCHHLQYACCRYSSSGKNTPPLVSISDSSVCVRRPTLERLPEKMPALMSSMATASAQHRDLRPSRLMMIDSQALVATTPAKFLQMPRLAVDNPPLHLPTRYCSTFGSFMHPLQAIQGVKAIRSILPKVLHVPTHVSKTWKQH